MKNVRAWAVVAVLLAGCGTGAAETADSVSAGQPSDESEIAIAPPPSEAPSQTAGAGASDEPTPLESVGAEVRDDLGGLMEPVVLPPGTYRSSVSSVPVTFTTPDEMTLLGAPVSLEPAEDSALDGALTIAQPDQVADLSPAITLQELQDAGGEPSGIPDDRRIDVPDDVGAWLGDAEAIEIGQEGSTTVDGQPAPWWEVEMTGDDAACIPVPDAPACQSLWPGGPDVGTSGAVFAGDLSRIWAVPAGDRTVLVVAGTPAASPNGQQWFDTAEAVVASFSFD